ATIPALSRTFEPHDSEWHPVGDELSDHNHGYPTVDPLKHRSRRRAQLHGRRNHGYTTVDPLKHLSDERLQGRDDHNHGYRTVEPLKLSTVTPKFSRPS